MSDDFSEDISEPARDGSEGSGVRLEDFRAYMPARAFIFMPCREPWPAASVDDRIAPIPVLGKNGKPKRRNGKIVTIRASKWLAQNQCVEQMTWAPGLPLLICDQLFVDGGWIERAGVTVLNLYRAPRIKLGESGKADPWLRHVQLIYPEDAKHIISWLAHRRQRPGEKINHALVLGGAQGIGKDTLLEPVKRAVGPWNFREIAPAHLFSNFNGFAKAVVLRVSEARDLGEVNRFAFYDHTKRYVATPPGEIRVNEKHLREYDIVNCSGFIITTNHKTDGIYLPPDDRRHYVAWSNLRKEDFNPEYWNTLWGWYHSGGFEDVAAYLAELDLTDFDPKAPPPQTTAFWEIVDVNRAPEDAELADVIDAMGNPDALTIKQLIANATGEAAEWLMDRRNRKAFRHRLERCGYVAVHNEAAKDGYWRIEGSRQPVYAKSTLSSTQRLAAAEKIR
jgi:hypothetical protein